MNLISQSYAFKTFLEIDLTYLYFLLFYHFEPYSFKFYLKGGKMAFKKIGSKIGFASEE